MNKDKLPLVAIVILILELILLFVQVKLRLFILADMAWIIMLSSTVIISLVLSLINFKKRMGKICLTANLCIIIFLLLSSFQGSPRAINYDGEINNTMNHNQ